MNIAFVLPSAKLAVEYEAKLHHRFPEAWFLCPGVIPCGRAFDLVLCHPETYGRQYLLEHVIVRTHPDSIVALMNSARFESADEPICGAW